MNNKLEYFIKEGYSEMDFDMITNMLKDAFWCIGIGKSEVIKGAKNSALLVGVFDSDNQQIGFMRVISDKTRFAYILDVIVDEKYRKKGIGQAMMKYTLNHPEFQEIYQWLLITKDAHGVYQKLGFKTIARPNDWMEIRLERPNGR